MVEIGFDIARLASPRLNYQLSPPWSRVVLPDGELGSRMSPYFPGNDRFGFRNPAVPERCDIVTIGDSNTYGFATTAEHTWPRQLQRLSGRTTYNMSCGGYCPCQYGVLIDRGLQFRPSLFIIGLTVANDFAETYEFLYRQDVNCPAKRLRSEDNALLDVLREADQRLPFVDSRETVQHASQPTAGIVGCLSQHSSLYAIARSLRKALVGQDYYSILREDDPPWDAFDLCLQRPGRFAYADQPPLRTVFRDPESLRRQIDLNDPRIQEAKRIVEQLLLAMRDDVNESHAQLLVAILPTKLMVYSELMARSSRQPPESYLRFIEAEQLITASIEQFLQSHDIEYVNATAALRDCLAHDRRAYPESDDGHPTRNGYRAIAEAVLARVQQHTRQSRPQPAALPLLGEDDERLPTGRF